MRQKPQRLGDGVYRCMAQARRLSRAFVAAGFVAAAVSSAAWLEGCTASAPARGSVPTAPSAAPAAATSTPAVSHDFTPLVLAPFGTAFKDVPVPLTEVLVFHQPDVRRTSEDADCFRPNVVVAFLGRAPTDHLLCFDNDRLRRVEASVVLPAAEAPALFAAACADWRRGNPPTALEADACEGRQGAIAFSARRTDGPDSAAATVSITLEAVSP
jgi:hypothetical protein